MIYLVIQTKKYIEKTKSPTVRKNAKWQECEGSADGYGSNLYRLQILYHGNQKLFLDKCGRGLIFDGNTLHKKFQDNQAWLPSSKWATKSTLTDRFGVSLALAGWRRSFPKHPQKKWKITRKTDSIKNVIEKTSYLTKKRRI